MDYTCVLLAVQKLSIQLQIISVVLLHLLCEQSDSIF